MSDLELTVKRAKKVQDLAKRAEEPNTILIILIRNI